MMTTGICKPPSHLTSVWLLSAVWRRLCGSAKQHKIGRFVERDFGNSVACFQRAEAFGNMHVAFAVAQALELGVSAVEEDWTRALFLLERCVWWREGMRRLLFI